MKAGGLTVESYWTSLFANLCEKRNIEDLVMNVSSGGGGAAVAVAAPAGGAAAVSAAAAAPAAEEKKVIILLFVYILICYSSVLMSLQFLRCQILKNHEIYYRFLVAHKGCSLLLCSFSFGYFL